MSPCGNTSNYDMQNLWNEPDEDIRSLKSLILFGIRGMAAYAYHAMVLGYTDETVNNFFYKALSFISYDLEMEPSASGCSGSGRGELKMYGIAGSGKYHYLWYTGADQSTAYH